MDEKINLEDKLRDKSIEAFLLGIEIYNKPTIKYRVEGFSFFICNAWELMLKSFLIKTKGEESIYYKDSERTLSLEACIKEVFTNDKDPLRINLEYIVRLRNTSTHLIVEEYEMIYVPLFQSCVINFSNKIKEYHNIDIENFIPYNFLSLQTSYTNLDINSIIAKYPQQIIDNILGSKNSIDTTLDNPNEKFSININHNLAIVKNPKNADFTVAVNKDSDYNAVIVKDYKDINNSHPYNQKRALEIINSKLVKLGITGEQMNIIPNKDDISQVNRYHFQLFVKAYNIKNNIEFCYIYKPSYTPVYSYSQKAIDFIIEIIKKSPSTFIEDLKKMTKK